MFTIKAIAHDRSVMIYEATQLRIAPDRLSLRMWEPQNTAWSSLSLGSNKDCDYSSIFIENEKGKTIESLVMRNKPNA